MNTLKLSNKGKSARYRWNFSKRHLFFCFVLFCWYFFSFFENSVVYPHKWLLPYGYLNTVSILQKCHLEKRFGRHLIKDTLKALDDFKNKQQKYMK